jgi:DNA polymerase-3 subunit gamma/tau
VLESIDAVFQRGQDLKKFYQELITHVRNLLVIKLSDHAERLVDLPQAEVAHLRTSVENLSSAALNHVLDALFRDEAAIRLSMQPRLALETSLIRICELKPALPIDALIQKVDQLRNQLIESGGNIPVVPAGESAIVPGSPAAAPSAPPSGAGAETASAAAVESAPSPQQSLPPADQAAGERFWQALLSTLQTTHPALAANLKAAKLLKVDEIELELELQGNDFNLKRVRRKDSLEAVQTACHTISGHRPRIHIQGKARDPAERLKNIEREAQVKQQALSHPLVAEAIELFGGKVVDVKIAPEKAENKDI